ncbi:Biotin/lipoyl attachment [Arabidopsis thaliana x Arabidopsis arenosa]|uniref:Biotin/lipoyl attachment n=1 Tax=Arabidopsis thaliana x Arabidopsis arenosa TaxID=1240361 RepID=A0A8T1ZLM2_9BRAS|nr:Biotin/lipoyl attachment [Arabidopsis thaliana x Arabidopsis arenosa]
MLKKMKNEKEKMEDFLKEKALIVFAGETWINDNSSVDTDTSYAEIEVMKICMPLLSPASRVIHFKTSEGQAMQAGELISKLDLD